jgi:hypothetical protein
MNRKVYAICLVDVLIGLTTTELTHHDLKSGDSIPVHLAMPLGEQLNCCNR